jgi:hypothetical protein
MHLEVLSARLSGAHRRSKRRKFLPQLPGVERMRSTGSQGLVTQGLREAGQRSAMDLQRPGKQNDPPFTPSWKTSNDPRRHPEK